MSAKKRSVLRGPRRVLAFVVLTVLFACAVAFAKTPRRPVHHHTARPPAHHKDAGAAGERGGKDAGTHAAAAPTVQATRANPDAGVLEAKTLDGGTRVFRFGEMEIEGRLRSPQLVYFLRRVRAEFAAGDLGHRSFMGELKETRKDPAF